MFVPHVPSLVPPATPGQRTVSRAQPQRNTSLGGGGIQPAKGRQSRVGVYLLRRRPSVLLGLVVLALMALVSLGASLVAPYDPLEMRRAEAFQPPSPEHWMGTDHFGRDILSRVLHGGRVSLLVALLALLVAAGCGIPLGVTAGYLGGRVDGVIMRLLDCLLAFPGILLAMALVTIIGPGALTSALAVGVVKVPSFARLSRASTLAEREREYVEAARCLGASTPRIVARTIFPNITSSLVVLATVVAANAILLEAALSFLGLGVRPPEPSWGGMLNEARTFLHRAPWYGVFPGLTIVVTVLCLNAASVGLRDLLDPRRRPTEQMGGV